MKRFDIKAGKFYVHGLMWEGFELNDKEKIVRVISKFRDQQFGLPQVTLNESRSGRELVSYGVFTGVKIR